VIIEAAPPETVDAEPPEPTAAPRDWAGLALAAYALLLPLAFTSRVFGWYVMPKLALSLIVVGPGLVVLARFVARRDVTACFAAAFLLIAAVSVLFADAPMMSLLGEYFSVNGWMLLAISVAVWSLGRAASGRAQLIENAILVAAVINAAVGWIELSTVVHLEGIGPYEGRAPGLMANPAFFAALCSGALWIALSRERRSTRPLVPLVLVGFLFGAVELSASRVSLIASVVIIIGFLVAHLRTKDWRRAAALAAVVIVGFGLAQLPSQSTSSGAERVQADSSGIGTRVILWRTALDGVADRPLLGYGPGRSQVATTPRRTIEIAKYEGPDTLYSDTHNFLVEELVTTGVLGFIALLGWLVLSGRRARGPLAGFAAVAAVAMLFEPQFIGLTPLVLLALGAATAGAPDTKRVDLSFRDSRPLAFVATGLAVIGLVAGGLLLVGDSHYYDAVVHSSLSDLDAAAATMPPWPQLPGVHAQVLFEQARATNDAAVGRDSLVYEREAQKRDPADPLWWYATGAIEETFGTSARANAAYHHALKLSPFSYQALAGLYRIAVRDDQHAAAVRYRAQLCRLGADYCPTRASLRRESATQPATR
jgi:O-antigen ligase